MGAACGMVSGPACAGKGVAGRKCVLVIAIPMAPGQPQRQPGKGLAGGG